jgi:hypothetical protein
LGETATATGGTIVTVAEADFAVSATDVAVTVKRAGVGTALAAVYRPAAVIVPQAPDTQPAPLMLQVTPVFAMPETNAENCCRAPAITCAVFGEIVTITGGMTVTVADADFVWSATEVAVIVTWAGEGTTPGAVYEPAAVMVPQVLPLQPDPLILQVTAVFIVPEIVALN